ncbi:hypothetical protein M9H77_17252 [Catharanthus roseus]|uniref:Uncharacterized protein n=1 Tax=Catharanthus roseus TaxID=4058 RepID=A0ACC0B423_CATRO|nr:hypothetical protein M9H77_17252 [Catharanthus roseus]
MSLELLIILWYDSYWWSCWFEMAKVVCEFHSSRNRISVTTEAGCIHKANYVILSVSIARTCQPFSKGNSRSGQRDSKLELQPPLGSESASLVSSPGLAVSDQLQQKITCIDTMPATLRPAGSPQCSPLNGGSNSKAEEDVRSGKFVLPII